MRRRQWVFTLQSIKSRIETVVADTDAKANPVFTLQSIKSRIETQLLHREHCNVLSFLLYSPLNQGLKLKVQVCQLHARYVFTLQSIKSRIET